MSQIGEHEALNDDPLSDEVLDEGELLKDSREDKNMAAGSAAIFLSSRE